MGDGDDLLVVRVADFDYKRLGTVQAKTMRNVPKRAADGRVLRNGDLLLEKSGGGEKQNVGRVVQWTGIDQEVCSNFITVLRPEKGFHSRWLTYMHRWLYLSGIASMSTKQTTGIQNLDVARYLNTPVLVPSFEEQIQIAAFLDYECERIQELEDGLRRLGETAEISLTEEIRRAFDLETADGPRLKDLGRWASGGTPPRQDEALWSGSVPWISAKDFSGRWRLRDPSAFVTPDAARCYSRIIEPGSVVVLSRGMALAHGLSAAVVGSTCCFNQDVRALTLSPDFMPEFFVVAMRAYDDRLRIHVDRAAHGTARLLDSFLRERIWMPGLDEQEAIVRKLGEREQRVAALRAGGVETIRRLSEYRDALIAEAVTGRFAPTNRSNAEMSERAEAALASEPA